MAWRQSISAHESRWRFAAGQRRRDEASQAAASPTAPRAASNKHLRKPIRADDGARAEMPATHTAGGSARHAMPPKARSTGGRAPEMNEIAADVMAARRRRSRRRR